MIQSAHPESHPSSARSPPACSPCPPAGSAPESADPHPQSAAPSSAHPAHTKSSAWPPQTVKAREFTIFAFLPVFIAPFASFAPFGSSPSHPRGRLPPGGPPIFPNSVASFTPCARRREASWTAAQARCTPALFGAAPPLKSLDSRMVLEEPARLLDRHPQHIRDRLAPVVHLGDVSRLYRDPPHTSHFTYTSGRKCISIFRPCPSHCSHRPPPSARRTLNENR